ncbi:hypothetical protein P4U99_23860 [Brevibacillus agri]|uniref:hypothetical protein n=3 Tax=Brevibacillus agri TaxID=51101 RepID=UPI002E233A0B|nr:hypothetical protein [Brevibacillus agri]MED1695011.1 hypothetical protein [Brevibacillus agri]MED1705123.1 hypothetical protein [Brevibacillus agri]
MRKYVLSGIGVIAFTALLTFGSSNIKAENESQLFAEQKQEIIVGAPVTVLDKNREGVYVGLTGLTVPLADEVYEIVEEINKAGGLKESKEIIHIKDKEGNVVIKIPAELKDKLKEKGDKLIVKHNKSVDNYKKEKRITRTCLKTKENVV